MRGRNPSHLALQIEIAREQSLRGWPRAGKTSAAALEGDGNRGHKGCVVGVHLLALRIDEIVFDNRHRDGSVAEVLAEVWG
jgi:hypothetical protein